MTLECIYISPLSKSREYNVEMEYNIRCLCDGSSLIGAYITEIRYPDTLWQEESFYALLYLSS